MTTALLALLSLSAPVTLEVNVQQGEVISSVRSFRAKVTADSPVSQVEFYVGDELRDSDTSTPYEFKLDTIDEDDGPLTLTFAAYTSTGDSDKKTFTVKVDNGMAKGPDFHVERGVTSLQDSKWDDAILAARIALRAKPGYNPARAVMARAYAGKGQFDRAQKYAEDWISAEPNSVDAADLLAGINVNKAFATVNRGSVGRLESLNAIASAFKSAIETRRKTLETRVDAIGKPTDENLIPYADALIRAGRYSAAIEALTPAFNKQMDRNEIGNRVVYAQLRAGRLQDALTSLNNIQRFGKLDAYGMSMMAMVQSIAGNAQFADRYMAQAVLSDPDHVAVRTAQAYLALNSGKVAGLDRISNSLLSDSGSKAEAAYYLFAIAYALNDLEDARKWFQRSVQVDPINEEAFLEEANRALYHSFRVEGSKEDKDFRLASARSMFQTALAARPESHRALAGLALTEYQAGNVNQAVSYADAATRAAPQQASTHYVYAAILRAANKPTEARLETSRAIRMDEARLSGVTLPTLDQAMVYLILNDRPPVLPAPR